ncbi:hypothetical protein D3C87_2048060 [compost metagenome]
MSAVLPINVRLVKETKMTQKNGTMTKTDTRSPAGSMKAAPARLDRSAKLRDLRRDRAEMGSVVIVSSAPEASA